MLLHLWKTLSLPALSNFHLFLANTPSMFSMATLYPDPTMSRGAWLKRCKRKPSGELLENFCSPDVVKTILIPLFLPWTWAWGLELWQLSCSWLWANGQQRKARKTAVMMDPDTFEPPNQHCQTLCKKNKTLFSLNHCRSIYLFLVMGQI